MNFEEKEYVKMTQTPIRKLIISLAIPTIISMLITAIYNVADTFFVSRLGVSASGAVGVVFPLMSIIQAVGFTLGMGGGSNISAKLGEKNNEEAQKIGAAAFYGSLFFGLLLTIFGMIFIKDLLMLLGSTETTLPYAYDYGKYIIYGAPIMAASFVLNNILRSEGKAKFSMIGLTIGGVLNCILDPIFIYVFNMGISGAAIATLISQCVSFMILLSFFLMKKSIITLNPKYITFQVKYYLETIKVGMPSLFRQGLASIATIMLNNQAGNFGGDEALSGMSIVSKIFMILFSIALGIGQGYQPVCGYNYASKNYKRVRESMMFTLVSCTLVMIMTGIIIFILSNPLIRAFIGEDVENVEEVVKIGGTALRFQCLAMPFMGINLVSNMTFQSTRKKFLATLLSSCRQGLFFIPLVLILPLCIGILGVELTQPLSDVLTCLFTIPFFVKFLKDLKELEYSQKEALM